MGRVRQYTSNRPGPCASHRCVKGGRIADGEQIMWQRTFTRGKGIRWHVECPAPWSETQSKTEMEEWTAYCAHGPCLQRTPKPSGSSIWCLEHQTPESRRERTLQTQHEESKPEEKDTMGEQTQTVEKGDALAGFAAMLAPYLDGKLSGKVDTAAFEAKLAEIEASIGNREPRVINITITDAKSGEIKSIGLAHKDMPELIDLLDDREHVYLYGPPGSGKSTAGIKAAEALGLEWGYISLNPRTAPSRVEGFMGADAKTYMGTPFRKLYAEGGVFVIDELDNAGPDLLTSLNAALENGHCAFPDGMVARSPNFLLVATGNTNGRGGNASFPERRAQDAATLDRFYFLEWGYDEALERAIAKSINPDCDGWVDWVIKARAYCAEHYPKVFVTPRASISGAKRLLRGAKPERIAHGRVFKGIDHETVSRILASVPLPEVRVKA